MCLTPIQIPIKSDQINISNIYELMIWIIKGSITTLKKKLAKNITSVNTNSMKYVRKKTFK